MAHVDGNKLGAKVVDIESSEVSYDNTTSALAATEVQAAIDELDATIDGLGGGHAAVTLNVDAPTQDSANLVGQEIQLVPVTTITYGVMSGTDKTNLDQNTTDSHTHANKVQLDLVSDGDHDVIVTGNPHAVTLGDVGGAPAVHTHVAADVTDFDTEVGNHVDVTANTAARHSHANKALLDTYTQTEVNLADAVAKKHASGSDNQTAPTVPYTPTVGTDWVDPDPVDVGEALDDLASLVTVLDGNDHTHSNKAQLDLLTDGDHDVIVTGNPHAVTKTDVGLSAVPNLDTTTAVSQTHASGSDNQISTGVPYTPTTGTDWVDPDPADVGDALDDLAGIVTTLNTDTHTHSNKAQLDLVTDGDHDAIVAGNPHSVTAAEVSYSNVTSGLTATEVQAAIDELDATIDGLPGGHDAVTLNADTPTQESANLTAQELQLVQATTSTDGVMSSEDKTKLDGIATGANAYVHPNHSGDVTSVADGATTIVVDVVTNTKLANVPTATIKGRTTAATGDPEDLTVGQVQTLLNVEDGSNNYVHPNHSGDVTSVADGAQTIAINTVTNTKLADVGTSTIKGRVTAATGDPEDLTPTQVRTLINVEDGSTADQIASEVSYDNSTSLLVATDVQGAIDELDSTIDGLPGGHNAVTLNVDTPTQDSLNLSTQEIQAVSATASTYGVATPTQITKLDGIATNANNYVHPNHSGDVTSVADGAQTIAVDVVTNTKLANVATSTMKGRVTAATGDPEDLTVGQVQTLLNVEDGSNNYTHPNHSGDVTSVADGAQTIAINTVTNTKLADVATATIKGRVTAATGDPEDLTATQVRTLINVEDGSTADQSDSEIETAYNNQVSVVTQVEAEAGTSTTVRRWTAERVKQAIAALATGAVASVFGRTGVVVALTSDYDANQIDYDNTTSGLTAIQVQAAIDELDATIDGLPGGHDAVTLNADTATQDSANLTAQEIQLVPVTTSTFGVMSGTDKTKLDGITTGANLYVHPNHSGDVTSVADGAQTIAIDVVTNTKLANVATATMKGRVTAATGDPEDLTVGQVQTLLNVEDGSNAYVHPNHSGDVTSVADGAQTIAVNTVTNTKLADVGTSTIKGRVTAATGDPEDLTATQVRTLINVADGANAYVHPNHSGDVTSVADGAQTIVDEAVTNAKLAHIATQIIKGRTTAATGDVEDLTATQVRAIINVENGSTADQSDAEIETGYNNQVSIVTQVEAEAGTSTTVRRWTAERVKQAIAALETIGGYVHPNHSGDVTSVADGAQTIAVDVVTNTKLANVATATIKGRITAATGDPEDLTATQARTLLNVADGANAYVHPNHSGDVTSVADGAQTIAINTVTNTKLADVATATIKGRVTAATGDPEDLTATQARTLLNVADGANAYVHPNHSGNVTSVADGATTIVNNVVTNARLADVPTATIKGRVTAATGDPQDLTATQVRTLINVEDGSTADQIASEVSYTNTTSGLVATDVQAAIDEIDSTVDGLTDYGESAFKYKFNTVLSGDPGSGFIAFNNATFASITAFSIHRTTQTGYTLSDLLFQNAYTNVYLNVFDGSNHWAFKLESSFSIISTWMTYSNINPLYASTTGVPSNNATVSIVFDSKYVPNSSISNNFLSEMIEDTIKGRASGAGNGNPQNLTATQVRTIINVADGANAYVHPNHSGDVTSVADGAQTIANDVVSNAKLANVATDTIKGRSAVGTGDPSDLTMTVVRGMLNVEAGANAYVHPNHSGDVTSVADGAQTIANAVVTVAKIQDFTAGSLIGRDNGVGTGVSELITVGSPLSIDDAILDIDNNGVTNILLAVVATQTIKGRITAATGDVEDLTATQVRTIINVADGANAYVHPNHSGDVTSVADGAQTIVANSVTLAKMADMATDSFIGRDTVGTGDPEILSATTVRSILNVEDGSNNYAHPNHTGDVTSVGDAGTTIAIDVVTNTKLANVATQTIKGRITAATGDPEDLTATQARAVLNVADGANNYVHPNHSGDVTSVADGAQTIAVNVVTNTKLADVATSTIKGRVTAATGDPEDLTTTQVRTLINVENGANLNRQLEGGYDFPTRGLVAAWNAKQQHDDDHLVPNNLFGIDRSSTILNASTGASWVNKGFRNSANNYSNTWLSDTEMAGATGGFTTAHLFYSGPSLNAPLGGDVRTALIKASSVCASLGFTPFTNAAGTCRMSFCDDGSVTRTLNSSGAVFQDDEYAIALGSLQYGAAGTGKMRLLVIREDGTENLNTLTIANAMTGPPTNLIPTGSKNNGCLVAGAFWDVNLNPFEERQAINALIKIARDKEIVIPYDIYQPHSIVNITASATATNLNETFIADTTGGAIDVTLPPEAECHGKEFRMRLQTDGGTDARFLNDAAGVIVTLADAGDIATVQCNGTTWYVISSTGI